MLQYLYLFRSRDLGIPPGAAFLVIEKYATPFQVGAVGEQSDQVVGTAWIVQNNEVRLNHGAGVRTSGQIVNNYIHDNGELGVSSWSAANSGTLVANNEISYNNYAGISMGYEAGGMKVGSNLRNLTARGNYVHHNRGAGLWCDGYCSGIVYQDNIVMFNADKGIFQEISHSLIAK